MSKLRRVRDRTCMNEHPVAAATISTAAVRSDAYDACGVRWRCFCWLLTIVTLPVILLFFFTTKGHVQVGVGAFHASFGPGPVPGPSGGGAGLLNGNTPAMPMHDDDEGSGVYSPKPLGPEASPPRAPAT